ncbi:MGMT family protein [Kineococcus sp. NBC_00420]
MGVANGRNPISIVVPCHRVVGHDGALVEYADGLWCKRFLLVLEEPAADDAGRLFQDVVVLGPCCPVSPRVR